MADEYQYTIYHNGDGTIGVMNYGASVTVNIPVEYTRFTPQTNWNQAIDNATLQQLPDVHASLRQEDLARAIGDFHKEKPMIVVPPVIQKAIENAPNSKIVRAFCKSKFKVDIPSDATSKNVMELISSKNKKVSVQGPVPDNMESMVGCSRLFPAVIQTHVVYQFKGKVTVTKEEVRKCKTDGEYSQLLADKLASQVKSIDEGDFVRISLKDTDKRTVEFDKPGKITADSVQFHYFDAVKTEQKSEEQ